MRSATASNSSELRQAFGGGARRCVGEPLAQAEIKTIAPTVLSRIKLEPVAPEPEQMVQRATVLVPKRGLIARIV